MRAKSWATFSTITLPLMRPGLANAFLLGFVESMADFGNPLVLGGNFEVLSTKIFFAVVGAAQDQGRAAVLSLVLLAFTLGAFWLQHAWLGKRVYTTVTGKGDSGLAPPLPKAVSTACFATALPWAIFTFAVYAVIAVGGFVRSMGRDYTPTLDHLLTALPDRSSRLGTVFLRIRMELVLRDDQGRGVGGSAHRRDRAFDGLPADAAANSPASGSSSSARF